MPGAVLVDTGPLVALFSPTDSAREGCRAIFRTLESAELVTTEAVLTEASCLLDFSPQAQAALQWFLASGRPRVEPMLLTERQQIAKLIEKYSDQPMDYADATLVVLGERLGTTRIFTLDRRDFSVYRAGRRRFEILPRT